MHQSETIDIGEAAKRSGLPASTLRYYEEKGLIQSVGRRGLKRLFATSVLEQLALITLGSQAGFSLEEIATMFTHKGQAQIDRNQLLAKADELEKNIKQLQAVRNGLIHAANCPAPSHLECPTFQRLMHIAKEKRKKAAK